MASQELEELERLCRLYCAILLCLSHLPAPPPPTHISGNDLGNQAKKISRPGIPTGSMAEHTDAQGTASHIPARKSSMAHPSRRRTAPELAPSVSKAPHPRASLPRTTLYACAALGKLSCSAPSAPHSVPPAYLSLCLGHTSPPSLWAKFYPAFKV